MGRRDRIRRPARSQPFKPSKPVILVVTEGAVTEKEYLEQFALYQKTTRVVLEIVKGAGVPSTIVDVAKELKRAAEKRAKRERDDNLLYDQVWCVFDIDQHPDVPKAKQNAIDCDIQLAISNPCIELWLWLHFAPQPGPQHRHDLQRMLITYIPNYNKHVNYIDYRSGYDAAEDRAEKLEQEALLDEDDGRNPTTGMWRLTRAIRCSCSLPWTLEQRDAIFEDYWRNGSSTCHEDDAAITFHLKKLGDNQYLLSATCPRCGEKMQMSRDYDPQRESFRSWTDDERKELMGRYLQKESTQCPVCESSLETSSSPYLDGSTVSIHCRRCGEKYKDDFPLKL